MKARILLINPPEIEQTGFNNPPLALLYLAGTLKKHQVKVKVLDGFFGGWGKIGKEIKKFKPTHVGATCLTAYRFKSLKVVQTAKQINPKVTTILGGVHATIMHTQLIENYPFLDIVVRGEGEQTLWEIARGKPLRNIKGITWRHKGQVKANPAQSYFQDINKIPFPAWEMLDLSCYSALPAGIEKYNGINLKRVTRVPVIFSRGCPGHCTFCSSWTIWRGWRGRSGKNMADEIEMLNRKQGIRHFVFADDCMSVDEKETINFCNEILQRNLKIAFNVQTRTDTVSPKMLEKLKEAGCYLINYGIETGSSEMLTLMEKSNTIKNSENAILWAKETGLLVNAQMITGNVGETFQTINQTIKFLQKTSPDFVTTLGGLWVYPGTKVYYKLKADGKINDNFWLKELPPPVYRGNFSPLQLRYFRMCLEKKTQVQPAKKGWNSLPFILFYQTEKLAKKNIIIKSSLKKCYGLANDIIKKIS